MHHSKFWPPMTVFGSEGPTKLTVSTTSSLIPYSENCDNTSVTYRLAPLGAKALNRFAIAAAVGSA